MFGAAFVQWDVLFNLTYLRNGQGELSPSSPRPELRFLRLPMRF